MNTDLKINQVATKFYDIFDFLHVFPDSLMLDMEVFTVNQIINSWYEWQVLSRS